MIRAMSTCSRARETILSDDDHFRMQLGIMEACGVSAESGGPGALSGYLSSCGLLGLMY
jgi:hypothetical protein